MDLKASDDTAPGSRKAKCRVYEKVGRHGTAWNGRYRYYLVSSPKTGAERKPQKSINRENYDIRSWTQPGRFFGTRIMRSRRK